MNLLSEIVGQRQLVRDVHESLESASRSGLLMGPALISADRWLEHTLARVTLGFDAHPSGKLVWRLIALDTQPDDPESLSDHDLLGALGFISGHLRTKFQGYLAEALAAGPICQLLQALGADDSQLRKAKLVWGDDIHVRSDHLPPTDGRRELGPDALVAVADEGVEPPRLTIMGLVEIKSYRKSFKRLNAQLDKHARRVQRAVQVEERWYFDNRFVARHNEHKVLRVVVLPCSGETIGRPQYVATPKGQVVVTVGGQEAPRPTRFVARHPTEQVITLGWSHPALVEAAFDMTAWYLGELGTRMFREHGVPAEWGDMTPAEAGLNTAKQALYYAQLRAMPKWHAKQAMRLYNVYGFGYAAAARATDTLWPQDIP